MNRAEILDHAFSMRGATADKLKTWLSASGRTIIQAAIDETKSSHPILDLEVLDADEVSAVAEILGVGAPSLITLDVPVRSVVALTGTRDAQESVGSWRMLFTHIHAVGWTTRSLKYFDESIAGARFDAPGAVGELTMVATGGLARIQNGMHRMVGGACWLGARDGTAALLRQVAVTARPAHPVATAKILELAGQGYSIQLAKRSSHRSTHPDFRIRVTRREEIRTFSVNGMTLSEVEVRQARSLFSRARSHDAGEHWVILPVRLIRALEDDKWLPESLRPSNAVTGESV